MPDYRLARSLLLISFQKITVTGTTGVEPSRPPKSKEGRKGPTRSRQKDQQQEPPNQQKARQTRHRSTQKPPHQKNQEPRPRKPAHEKKQPNAPHQGKHEQQASPHHQESHGKDRPQSQTNPRPRNAKTHANHAHPHET